MGNLNDLINLAKADGGKFFVIDESGEARLVIMSIEDYQRMLLGKLQKQVRDIEEINKQIIKAQLKDEVAPPFLITEVKPPTPKVSHKFEDLREEVIDLSFDFEGPKTGIDEL
jgi:hypothetical protein